MLYTIFSIWSKIPCNSWQNQKNNLDPCQWSKKSLIYEYFFFFLPKNDFFRAHNFFEVKSFVNKDSFLVALIFIFHNFQIQ